MLQQEIDDWVDQLFEQRLAGAEFTQLRKTLQESGVAEDDVKQIINIVNDRELDTLDTGRAQLNPNVFLILALITLFSGVALAYSISNITDDRSYQFLNAIPVAGSVVLFYNYYQNKQKYRK
ncbi:MAG: hypothetical protein JXQ87_18255 [Bacteroidia bacterium]